MYENQEKTGSNRSNELKKLQNEYNQLVKSPKTIMDVSQEDLMKIKNSKAYFYRKFSKDSDIENYFKNIINKKI